MSDEVDNVDRRTVRGFGFEWTRFDQSGVPHSELLAYFENYFSLFPWEALPMNAEGVDIGCGTGRWAQFVAPRVGTLHCVDASSQALAVARRTLAGRTNCHFHESSLHRLPLADGSMDFAYALGVLHHVPDPQAAIASCAAKLKGGAPFLVYIYYALDNQCWSYRLLWRTSDLARRAIARLPQFVRALVADAVALLVYLPFARAARILADCGMDVRSFPLSLYRDASFYTMRTDALDRFGTAVEQRFSRAEIERMMLRAGLERVTFREAPPYWCALGYRAAPGTRP